MKRIWEYYTEVFALYLDKVPNEEMIKNYLRRGDIGVIEIQDFINSNIKDSIKWSTTIGILDNVDNLIKEAKDNGNIKLIILDHNFLDYSQTEHAVNRYRMMYQLNLTPMNTDYAIYEVSDFDGILPPYIKMSHLEYKQLMCELTMGGRLTYPDIYLHCPIYDKVHIDYSLEVKREKEELEDDSNSYKASDEQYEDLNLSHIIELYNEHFNEEKIKEFNNKFEVY